MLEPVVELAPAGTRELARPARERHGLEERERRLEAHAWNCCDGRGDGPLLADDDGRRHEQLGHVVCRELEQAAGTCRPAEADEGRTVGGQDDVVGVETPVDHVRLV